ncbi:hypothetical protein CR513_34905, partial [Mucuna pruriens]
MVLINGWRIQPTGEQSRSDTRRTKRVLIEQSLHFEFKANNNQAEYEVLLVGMKLAKELEVRTLTAKSDLKLVTG